MQTWFVELIARPFCCKLQLLVASLRILCRFKFIFVLLRLGGTAGIQHWPSFVASQEQFIAPLLPLLLNIYSINTELRKE